MKKFLPLTFVLILIACSAQPPQVTVTLAQRVTVTLPPTNTPAPTATFTPIPTATAPQFSPDTWANMLPEQRLAAVPAMEGLKFNTFSTLEGMDQMAIYLDENNNYAGSYDMITGEYFKTGTGLIEVFPTEDGGWYEMRAYGFEGMSEKQAKEAVEEMLHDILVNEGVTYGLGALNISTNRDLSHINRLRTINGLVDRAYFHIAPSVNERGDMLDCAGFGLGGGTVFGYTSDEYLEEFAYLRDTNPTTLKNNLMRDYYQLPQGL